MEYLIFSFFLSYCHWSGPKVAAELRVESKSTSGTQSSPRLDPVDNDTDGDPLMAALGLDAIEAAIDRLLILAVGIRRSARRNHKLRHGTSDHKHKQSCCVVYLSRQDISTQERVFPINLELQFTHEGHPCST